VGAIDLNAGTFAMGNSTVKVSGDVDIAGATVTMNQGTGILNFVGTGTQVIRGNATDTTPAIKKSGGATLQLADRNLKAISYTHTAGILDMNSLNFQTTGDFSITGRVNTFSNLGGRTITVGGAASLNGSAGDSLNLDPSSIWNINVTGTLAATYSVIKNSVAGTTSGDATSCRDATGNVGWNFPVILQPNVTWTRNDLTNVYGAAIGDTKIFVGAGTNLKALNLSDGTDDWSFSTSSYGNCSKSTITYFGGSYKVFASAGTYVIGRQDGSGTSTALFAVDMGYAPSVPYPSPDDSSFYIIYNNKLSKRRMSDGLRVNAAGWTSDVAVASASTIADMVVFNNNIYVGSTTGVVRKFDADGTPGATYNVGSSINFPLLVQNSTLYISPNTNALYAVNTPDMSAKWASPLSLSGTNSGPAFMVSGSSVLYVASGTKIQKVTDNGSSGANNWSYDAGATIQSGPINFNTKVYFGRNSGRYYAVTVASGSLTGDWPYQSAAGNATSGPWIDQTNSRVIFGTDAGEMRSFSINE
jgi:hypothetical protein